MMRLLRIELEKILRYPAFWALLIIYATLFLLSAGLASQIKFNIAAFDTMQVLKIKEVFEFPVIWNTFAWIASWYNLFLSLTMIVLITNEFTYRTFRQQMIAGLKKEEILFSKLIVLVIIAIVSLLFVFLSTVVFGIIMTNSITPSMFFGKMYYLLIYFVQTLAYLSFGFFAAVLLRNTALSIVLFIIYPLFEALIRLFFNEKIRQFFPSKVITSITTMPDIVNLPAGTEQIANQQMSTLFAPPDTTLNIIMGLVYMALFIGGSYLLIKKRDL